MTALARRPDRANPLPLWAQVLDDLKRRLTSGEFEQGLPPERDLIDQYRVSRHTMRDALGHMDAEGLISRERGRGTFVKRSAIEQRTGSLYSIFRSVEEQGFVQRSTVLDLDRRTAPDIAARMDLRYDTEFVYLHRLRRADTTPIATDELWLVASVAAPLLPVDFEHTGVYSELERLGVRPGSGWERIQPIMPSASERSLLELSARQPVFLVERFNESGGAPLEWRRTVLRGDLYAFHSSWTANGTPLENSAFALRRRPRPAR